MISVFNGRSRSLGGGKNDIYVQVSVEMRACLHLFKGSALAVFMAIALHADADGFAFPSIPLLCKETGCHKGTVTEALKKLRAMTICGQRVLCSAQRLADGNRFESNGYLIFPSAEEAKQYDEKKATRDENHVGVLRSKNAYASTSPHQHFPHTEKPYAALPDAEKPNTEKPDAKQSNMEAEPFATISIEKQTAMTAPTRLSTLAVTAPTAVAFQNMNSDEVSKLVALVADLRISETDAASIVRTALKRENGAEVVERNARWWPASGRAENARSVAAVFRTCVNEDWAKADADKKEVKQQEAKQQVTPRRYVQVPADFGKSTPPARPSGNMARLGEIVAQVANRRDSGASSKTTKEELDAIYASLSSCAKQRLHKEAIEIAKNIAQFIADEIDEVPIDVAETARGSAARTVLSARNNILRERAAAPFIVNGKPYYDEADARAAQIDLDFT